MTEELLRMLHLDPRKVKMWTINFMAKPRPTITVRYLRTIEVERSVMPIGDCTVKSLKDMTVLVPKTIEVQTTFDIPAGFKMPSREEQIER